MSIIIGGTTVDTVVYNGTTLDEVFYNNTKVYESSIKSVLTVAYGTNVSSVKVDGVTIANGGSFEYAPGDSKSIVISYSGYVTGDGYVHSVNNNTTLNSTRWKYNTSYTMAGGLSKTVSISSNLVAVSNTITFSLTDAEFNSLSSPTITFNAAKSGTQTYKSKVVSVPYTAYAWETSMTFSGTINSVSFNFTVDLSRIVDKNNNAINKRGKYNTEHNSGDIASITVYSFNNNGLYSLTPYYSGKNIKIVGGSGTVYQNKATVSEYSNLTGRPQYSYTAYRNETQYYWE